MPSTHMGGIMLGFAISGFLANIVRIIVLLSLPDDMLLSSLIYFSMGGVLLMLGSYVHWRFQKLEFTKFYIAKSQKGRDKYLNISTVIVNQAVD